MSQGQIQTIVVHILNEVVHNGRNLNEVLLKKCSSVSNLSDLPAVKNIIYGVLRYYKTLEYWLKILLKSPVACDFINQLLLVSLYQLTDTKTAHYAVVNEAVCLARLHQKGRYQKLVNAVLRNFLRSRPDQLSIPETEQEALYNLPLWWIQKLKKNYPDEWLKICTAYQQHPPLTLRVNQRKSNVISYLEILKDYKIEAEIWDTFAIHILKPISVDKIPYFFEGMVSVQDLGAQQAAKILDVHDGAYVLDACSAPGGKTGHLLEWANCELLALDIDARRLQKVAGNLSRLKLSAQLKCVDAAKIELWWDGRQFDYILVDLPCSATGVVKRNPDIRWLRQENDAGNIAQAQIDLLDNLWECLKSKGKMLLSTCSVFAEENQQQVLKFLNRNSNARLVQELQILPDEKQDGFYYALVQKS